MCNVSLELLLYWQNDQHHPVWGQMDNYAVGREKRKQLLLMLCQHEAERLEVWAQPLNSKESTSSRPKISSEKWIEYARTAFSVDPRITFSLASRFPSNTYLKAEITLLVQVLLLALHYHESLGNARPSSLCHLRGFYIM
jgi:phosphatidylinositol 4-kinase